MSTVLIIEQNPRLTGLMEAVLRDAGLEAVEAHSVEGAFTQAETVHPGVIVFDAEPADADRRGYLMRIRALSPESRVVDLHGDVEIGADTYLHRPFDAEALVRTVRRLAWL